MTPRLNLIPVYHAEEPADEPLFTLIELDFRGNVLDWDEARGGVDFTVDLADMISLIPTTSEYIGCVNCCFPVAMKEGISEIICTPKHSYIHSAYVLPFENLFQHNIIENVSSIFWRTQVRCVNCNIQLSHINITVYNCLIDEFSCDYACIILNSASVSFFRKVRVY